MIVLIDNYDSFTYNVYQYLTRLSSEEVRVVRNNEITVEELSALAPSRLVISPGPGRPEDAGISIAAIMHFAGKIPILAVCLGHQAIAHGKGLFRTIGKKGIFTRYHSLAAEEETIPAELEVTARAEDGEIMGLRHREFEIEGVQFHPESIAAEKGDELFKAFLAYRREGLAFSAILASLLAGKDLSRETAELFMEDLTEGSLDERQTSAILTALSSKGPAAEEIAGCASVLCRKKTPIQVSGELVDVVGTGGDGIGSFNISSMSALVAASCGAKIAKHGNRAVSSKSGSADFYEALGICIDVPPAKTAEVIEKTGFGFLYAPVYHSAMRFAAPVRRLLGVKTIMNLVGPLSNPANAQYQMIGVYDKSLMHPVARASKMLGSSRVMVVCSQDGMDEISPCDLTDVVEISSEGSVTEYTINPADFGIGGCRMEELLGGDSRENARLATEVLAGAGRKGILEAVALNAAATLYISGVVPDIAGGYSRAKEAIADGRVSTLIEQVREASCA